MAALRWCTIGVLSASAALLWGRLYRDLMNQQAAVRWRSGEALFLSVTPAVLALSLGQWEILTVASDIDGAAVNLLFLISIFLLDQWCSTGRMLLLAGGLLSAALTSMTQLQGILVWPAMALLLILDAGRRKHAPILIVVVLAFAVSAAAGWLSLDDRSSLTFTPLQLLLGNVIVIGSAYLGFVNNEPVLTEDIMFGCLIWLLTVTAALIYWTSAVEVRARMNKYVALVAFGFGTSLMIEIGRLHATPDHFNYLASSRFAAAVMPWGWGLCGLFALSIRSGRLAAAAAAVQMTAVFLGVGITNLEEARMAPFRRQVFLHQIQVLREEENVGDIAALPKTLYVSEARYVNLVAPVRAYLRANGLSLFRAIGPSATIRR